MKENNYYIHLLLLDLALSLALILTLTLTLTLSPSVFPRNAHAGEAADAAVIFVGILGAGTAISAAAYYSFLSKEPDDWKTRPPIPLQSLQALVRSMQSFGS